MIAKIQQGDVILRRIDSIPHGAKESKRKDRYTLEYGEASGHHHTIIDPDKCRIFEFNDKTYIEVLEKVRLTHQEHSLRDTVKNLGGFDALDSDVKTYLKEVVETDPDMYSDFELFVRDVPDETIIPPGIYEKDKPLEYDHWQDVLRPVMD